MIPDLKFPGHWRTFRLFNTVSGSFPRFSFKSKQRPYRKTHVGFKMIHVFISCQKVIYGFTQANQINWHNVCLCQAPKKYHILFTQTLPCEPYSHNLQLFIHFKNLFYHIHVYVNIKVTIFLSIVTNHTSVGTRYLSLFLIQKTGNNQNTLMY